MKLYEIASEMQHALSLLEGEGEVDMSTLVEYLDQLESEYENKLDNIACMIKNEQSMSGAIQSEIDTLTERKKSHDKRALALSEYIASFMNAMGLKTYESARNKISFRKSEQVVIDDVEVFKLRYPQMVVKQIVEIIPTKPELKKIIKAGTHLDGVEIMEKQNLQIK